MTSKTVKLQDFLQNIDFFVEEAKKGKIFVYPTDTIYGIGGIFPLALEKVYKIKQRPLNKKVSIIWPKLGNDFLKNLPIYISDGLYERLLNIVDNIWQSGQGWTIIGKIDFEKFGRYLNPFANKVYSDSTIGVRILNHDFQKFIDKLSQPFITTSANISGEEVIRKVDDLPKQIYEQVDWIIDGGILNGSPSVLIKIIDGEINIVKR